MTPADPGKTCTQDTRIGLIHTAAVVNTRPSGADELAGLRNTLRDLWQVTDPGVAAGVAEQLLAEARARPQLVTHDGVGWHLHISSPDKAWPAYLAIEAAMGVIDLIRGDDLDRLKRCAAPGCAAVLVDLSRNRSKRYCANGTCGNRVHVAAYRARRRTRPARSATSIREEHP
ncbi:CGNR zinc finger domain-containing protein [Kribbella sp. NPDC050124]|uniref:CGNR zinc finger domain-containing protein n=1 Tax=Kribbella sp. NPDC050124 TaxID=3364114 RepID=UPI0037B37B46